MPRIATIVALVLGLYSWIGATALAASDRALTPLCKPLGKLLADFDAKTHFAPLTPGQFHFSEGLYVGSPTTPEGLPPGDGALLANSMTATRAACATDPGRAAPSAVRQSQSTKSS